MTSKHFRFISLAAGALTLVSSPAFAHHAMGGELPGTFMQGLLSGLAHPVIGLDHFAFIAGVGIFAAIAGLGLLLPLLFVAFMCAGLGLHFAAIGFPGVELAIALSAVLVGLAILWRRSGPNRWIEGALFAAAGTAHGYAFAESIVGAETGVVAAYVLGLVAVQMAVAAGAYALARTISSGHVAGSPVLLRGAGLAILLAGLYFAAGATGVIA